MAASALRTVGQLRRFLVVSILLGIFWMAPSPAWSQSKSFSDDVEFLRAHGKVVVLAVRSMNPADVLTIGTLFQTSRLFGGEIGTAFMQTFVRVREQVHSNLIGLHVDSLGGQTADRLAAYRNAVAMHSSDAAHAVAQGTSLLGSAVAKQAAVLSYIDGFLAAAIGAYACLFVTALLRRLPSTSKPRALSMKSIAPLSKARLSLAGKVWPVKNTTGKFTPRRRNWANKSMPDVFGNFHSSMMTSAATAPSSERRSEVASAKLWTTKPRSDRSAPKASL